MVYDDLFKKLDSEQRHFLPEERPGLALGIEIRKIRQLRQGKFPPHQRERERERVFVYSGGLLIRLIRALPQN